MARRRQHGEGSVYRRTQDGRWLATVDLGWKNGRRQRKVFTGATPEVAIERRAQFLELRRGGFTLPAGRQPYVSEWVTHWLHNVARAQVEATTWHGSYRQKAEDHIVPYFERVPLADLDEEKIEQWHRDLEGKLSARTGRPLSAATITQCHRILARALKVAVTRGRMPRNPCSNVTPPRGERPEARPPSAEDIGRILARCETWPNGARWILALRTGLRQGEALALRWRDVKLTAPGSVTIWLSAAQVQGKRVVKQPKSRKSRRTVPLTPSAAAALARHKQAQAVASLDGLVFTSAKGGPVHPRADYQDWQRLLADVGLPPCRVHDARHAVATRLLEQGVDPRVVQDVMGWSTLSMTEVYQHVSPALMARALEALDG